VNERTYPLPVRPRVRIPADPATHLAIALEEWGWPYMPLEDVARLRALLDGFLFGRQAVTS
jgi:hypothetical protein